MTDFGSTMLINAVALLTVILALWAYSVKIRDVSFIDAFWAFGMVLLAWATWTQSNAPDARSHLLLGLTSLWGLRLTFHLWTRSPSLAQIPSCAGREVMKSRGACVRNTESNDVLLQLQPFFSITLPMILA